MPLIEGPMTPALIADLVSQVQAGLARFTDAHRLYAFELDGSEADLIVEAFQSVEGISLLNAMSVLVLSTDAALPVETWLRQSCRLRIRLADGGACTLSGWVRGADRLEAEAGLARYRLWVVPWWWQLTQQARCRVFQDKTVLQILAQVLAGYPQAQWSVSPEVEMYVSTLPGSVRPYTVQYRETDWDFVTRLLAEAGLGLCAREAEAAPAGELHVFADSRQWPEDAGSAAAGGIRFHRGASQEDHDAVQQFGQRLQVQSSSSTTLSYQPNAKRAVSGSSTSVALADGTRWNNAAPAQREQYRYSTRHASSAEAQAAMTRARQHAEAAARQWWGEATTRTLRAGAWFTLTQSALTQDDLQGDPTFAVLHVERVGLNNLPKAARESLQTLFAASSTLDALTDDARHPFRDNARLMDQVQNTGFALRFRAVHREQPWAPALLPKPLAPGRLTARVTGPGGALTANGHDELWIDAQGRVQVRFHWQWGETADDTHTVWLRVKQQQAGNGLGLQLMPRIGHEVLVGFVQGDIDCPLVLAPLYNGRGEGGVAPTPAGQQQAAQAVDTRVFERSSDHESAAQANLAGGHSPAWHGMGTPQGHAGALSGFKDAALGGAHQGFNQLAFDDSDAQLRIQLRSTHQASELSLGHLRHQADNHRGSFRGQGCELRTDGYVSLRAAQGVLLTTYAQSPTEPAGELTPGLALARQADTLLSTFASAARTHQGIPLASHTGSVGAQRSVHNDNQAPFPALHLSLKGMVSRQGFEPAIKDASQRSTTLDAAHVPQLTDPVIVMTAQAHLVSLTGQAQVEAVGDTQHRAAGQDHAAIQGGHHLHHTGQALSVLSGVSQPGEGNLGLQAIAAHGPLHLQAQSSTLKVLAQQDLTLGSKDRSLTVAAPKAIHLRTQAGARLSIVNGNIEVHAPGTLTIHRATLKQVGPERVSYQLPVMPHATLEIKPNAAQWVTLHDQDNTVLANRPYTIWMNNGAQLNGTTDEQGATRVAMSESENIARIQIGKRKRST